MGPLDALRVTGKFPSSTSTRTGADLPGRGRAAAEDRAERRTVAVRKLSVVDFDSPLAVELGVDILPYVIVFTPEGKKTEIRGAELGKIDKALKRR